MFCVFGIFLITSSLRRRAKLSKDEKPPCDRKLARGCRSAKSAAVERTAGSTTGREPLRIALVCKETPAARGRGLLDQNENPER